MLKLTMPGRARLTACGRSKRLMIWSPGVPQPDICKSLYLANAEISKRHSHGGQFRIISPFSLTFRATRGIRQLAFNATSTISTKSKIRGQYRPKNQERKSPPSAGPRAHCKIYVHLVLTHIRDCKASPGRLEHAAACLTRVASCFLTRKVWVITV